MRTRVLRRPIVFLRFPCSILILLTKTVRCSMLILLIKLFVVAFVRCSVIRCSILILFIKPFVVAFVRCSILILLTKTVRCSIRSS
jgi:hypothetical protein